MRKVVLTLLILAGMSPCLAKYSGGTGTPADPYRIADANDLLALAADTDDYGSNFILTADIDLAPNLPGRQVFATAVIAPDIDNENWDFDGVAFAGVFDGAGHKITNLTIIGVGNNYLGLFGYVSGQIKNLGVENISITGGWCGYCGCNSNELGGLVGENHGSISNCNSTGTVNGGINAWDVGGLVGYNNEGSISDSHSTGTVAGGDTSYCLGGLVGYNNLGPITNCYSSATVNAGDDSEWLGGLVGVNWDATISDSYCTGAVTAGDGSLDYNVIGDLGGLVGENDDGIINNCYSTGDVTGGNEAEDLGGLVGNNLGIISCCYSTGAVAGGDGSADLGGLVGWIGWDTISYCYFLITSGPDNGAGTPLTGAQMKQQASFIGWDFVNEAADGTCNYWEMVPGGYPVLSVFNGHVPVVLPGSGTQADPYRISDANDLGTVWYRPQAHYVLVNDIGLCGINWSAAVSPVFSGVFDGKGHCISNLSVNGSGNLGLFGLITPGGLVKNLGIEGCVVSGGGEYIGGLAGENHGTISNSHSTGTVNGGIDASEVGGLVGSNSAGVISKCHSVSVVNGGNYGVGGLVGVNSQGNISGCFSTGSVTGDFCIGGMVGDNLGGIIDSYSTGIASCVMYYAGGVTGYNDNGSVRNCYSIGAVSGFSDIGGLIGYDDNGDISSCYFLVTSGPDNGYGAPLTDTQMKQQGSFIGWDFVGEIANGTEDIWRLCNEGLEYPKLAWQYLPGDVVCPDGVGAEDLAVLCDQWLLEEIPADLAPPGGDGIVDFADFAVFADQWDIINNIDALLDFTDQWLKIGLPVCSADISPSTNGNGRVNTADFAILANHWLEGF